MSALHALFLVTHIKVCHLFSYLTTPTPTSIWNSDGALSRKRCLANGKNNTITKISNKRVIPSPLPNPFCVWVLVHPRITSISPNGHRSRSTWSQPYSLTLLQPKIPRKRNARRTLLRKFSSFLRPFLGLAWCASRTPTAFWTLIGFTRSRWRRHRGKGSGKGRGRGRGGA